MEEFFATHHIEDEIIAVGVSGGADSLALVLRLQDLGKKVVALTVDHGLRSCSDKEANYVAEVMQRFGIEHHILNWHGEKPTSGIEQKAREARYELLQDWCVKNNVKLLVVGHHLRDQAETFLLRLHRGSGLFGLSCMLPIVERKSLKIIRPQLKDKPEDLRAYLEQKNVAWVEDESNQCDDFLRVKMRKFLPLLFEQTGISEERLGQTAAVLAQTRNFVESQTQNILKNQVSFIDSCVASMSLASFAELHPEMQFQVSAALLCRIGKRIYIPEAKELFYLLSELKKTGFRGCTLAGCEVISAQKKLWIIPQYSQKFVLPREAWEKYLKTAPQYAKSNLPYKVRRAIYLNNQE